MLWSSESENNMKRKKGKAELLLSAAVLLAGTLTLQKAGRISRAEKETAIKKAAMAAKEESKTDGL